MPILSKICPSHQSFCEAVRVNTVIKAFLRKLRSHSMVRPLKVEQGLDLDIVVPRPGIRFRFTPVLVTVGLVA